MGNPAESSSDERLRRVEAQLARALDELEATRKARDELEEHFQEVVASRSWRITEPLRQFTKLRRALFPLFRSRSLQLSARPLRSLLQSGELFRINGASPALSLDCGTLPCPNGWVDLSATVRTAKGTLFFYLYMGVEGVFQETDRLLLSFDDNELTHHPIYIPRDVNELRLDVYDFDGSFELSKLQMRELGSLQVLWSLMRKFVVPLRNDPKIFWIKVKRGLSVLRHGGFTALRAKLLGGRVTNNYSEWVQRFDNFELNDSEKVAKAASQLKAKPKISIITPVFNPPERHLRDCLDSVLAQGYPEWELCLADDASTLPHVRTVLEEYKTKDSRIKVVYRERSGHIAEASNSALDLAGGDYVAFLDHDDELTVDALYMVAKQLNETPNAQLLYSDEDKKTGYGMRINPHFKSDWNPELLLQQNYVCHLLVLKKSLIDSINGFRKGFDGAQDWDLILRASEQLKDTDIVHIPHVLYHWKIIAGSTAQATSSKPYVLEAQRKAVQEHLDRIGCKAEVSIRPEISNLEIQRALPSVQPMVSIIILTRDKLDHLSRCVESIFDKSSYKNFEVIIVDNGSMEPKTKHYFEKLKQRGVIILHEDSPFNFSALNNLAARHAKGSVLAFLNNDLEVINEDWLERLSAHCLQKGVGAVGARLLFPNKLLQHGGVIIGIGGVAGHNHKGRPHDDPGYFNRAILSQNLSAVTAACMIMPREAFDAIDGFDEQLSVAFNDVDLCLRLRAAGYKIVYEPAAELYHYESASRGYENTAAKFERFEREIELMKERWGKTLLSDPYYNPNLTQLSEDFMFAFPPRVTRGWRG